MFWRSVFDLLGFSGGPACGSSVPEAPVINPATGLPMLDNFLGGVDAGGSPFGVDLHQSSMDSFSSMDSNPWD